MSEQHDVAVRFRGEKLVTHTDGADVFTLYRTPEGLFRVYIDEGESGLAWLESGRSGNGLTAAQVRTLFPEFEAATRPGRGLPQGRKFPTSGDAGA